MPVLDAFSLDDRTALVTAAVLITDVITDVDPDAARRVAERITAAGGKAESCALDVRDRAAADAAAARAAELGGGTLHVQVNTGRMLNVISAAGLVGTIGQANYGAAKAGIVGLTKSPARAASYITGQVLPVDGGTVI